MANQPLRSDSWMTAERTRAQWMGIAGADINDLSVFDLAIPGTHNSGSFSSTNPIGVRCQQRSILEQLQSGIRYLDFRVWAPKEVSYGYFHNHDNYWYRDQDARESLKQIRSFMYYNPGEFIVLHLAMGSENYDDKPANLQFYAKLVCQELGDYLIPKPTDGVERKVKDVRNKIILVAAQDGFFPTDLAWHPDQWMTSSYSFGIKDGVERSIEVSMHNIESAILRRPTIPRGFAKSEFNFWNGNIHAACIDWQHPALHTFLQNWALNVLTTRLGQERVGPAAYKSLNIIQTDFFDKDEPNYRDSSMVRQILILNDPEIRAAMAEVADVNADRRSQTNSRVRLMDAWN